MPKRIKSLQEILGTRSHVRACIKYKSHQYPDNTWAKPVVSCYIESVSDKVITISQNNPAFSYKSKAEISINKVLAICAPDIKLMAIFNNSNDSS